MSLTGRSLQGSAAITGASASAPSSATLAGASTTIAEMLLDLDELNDANVLGTLWSGENYLRDVIAYQDVGLAMEDHATREQRKINLYTLASSLSAPIFWKPSTRWKW